MKVIFLDFDGVVVCLPKERGKLKGVGILTNANPEPVSHLNSIISATGAKVVVSSSWRLHHTVEMLQGTLSRAGFVGQVIDITPHRPDEERGFEIQEWLSSHPEVESFVSLDDDADRGRLPLRNWVLVENGWFGGGLQPHHAERAIAVLKGAE